MSWLNLVEHHEEVESTMKLALDRAEAGAPSGTTIVAQSQRAGRGRRGRTWFSPPNAGLWMTTLVYPKPQAKPHTLSLVTGAALWSAIGNLGFGQAKLKWPNDIEANGKKLAGILLEHTTLKNQPAKSAILIGIGLNLSPAKSLDLPADIEERYIGLSDLVTQAPHAQVLEEVLRQLEQATTTWEQDGLSETFKIWDQADALLGETVRALGPDGPIEGIARGLAPGGQLKLETSSAELLIDAGEVTRIRLKS